MDWRNRGACRDAKDKDLWFPVGTGAEAVKQTAQAKAVCRRCPVTQYCLAWAVDHGVDGIWGATTENERRALRRQVRAA